MKDYSNLLRFIPGKIAYLEIPYTLFVALMIKANATSFEATGEALHLMRYNRSAPLLDIGYNKTRDVWWIRLDEKQEGVSDD